MSKKIMWSATSLTFGINYALLWDCIVHCALDKILVNFENLE